MIMLIITCVLGKAGIVYIPLSEKKVKKFSKLFSMSK